MRLDTDALAMLAAIIRAGSFDGAAKMVGVTQSAISQRIKLLEDTVGSILIVRGRPCVPTETGLILFAHYEKIELLQAETIAQLKGETQSDTPTQLRVSANYDSLATWFPFVIQQASDTLNLRLEILSDDQDFTEHLLRSGEVLAALSTAAGDIPGCRKVNLGAMEYTAIASPEFMDRHFSDGVTAEAVGRAPLIAFDHKDRLPQQWAETRFGYSPALNPHHVPSYEGHMVCALNSVGWAIMPLLTVAPFITQGKLVDLSPDMRLSIRLNWFFTRQSNAVLSGLSEIVQRQAREWLVPPG